MSTGVSDNGFRLLHQLRLRGMVPEAEATDAAELCGADLAAQKGTFLVLTTAGRDTHAKWARLAPGSDEEVAARTAFDQFLPLNTEFLQVSTAWQVRPGNVPNDHRDARYDHGVLERLATVDERAGPVVRRLGSAVDRFSGYRGRLRDARHRVEDGDHEWFLSPTCDSYHTVWMQLHEDLLLALGLDRGEEAAS